MIITTNKRDAAEVGQKRKIKPTRRSVSGRHMFRGESSIPYESTLERDFVIRQEFFMPVLDVIPQPVEIPFTGHEGRTYTYTPDFLVYHRIASHSYPNYPKPILVEVKPRAEWRQHWRKWLPKWKAAYRYASDKGWQFHVHDESKIRDQTLSNIQFLARYRRMRFPEEESAVVLKTVSEMGTCPLHYILSKHFLGHYRPQGEAHVWHLLATRRLDCDMNRILGESTNLWVPSDE